MIGYFSVSLSATAALLIGIVLKWLILNYW